MREGEKKRKEKREKRGQIIKSHKRKKEQNRKEKIGRKQTPA